MSTLLQADMSQTLSILVLSGERRESTAYHDWQCDLTVHVLAKKTWQQDRSSAHHGPCGEHIQYADAHCNFLVLPDGRLTHIQHCVCDNTVPCMLTMKLQILFCTCMQTLEL